TGCPILAHLVYARVGLGVLSSSLGGRTFTWDRHSPEWRLAFAYAELLPQKQILPKSFLPPFAYVVAGLQTGSWGSGAPSSVCEGGSWGVLCPWFFLSSRLP